MFPGGVDSHGKPVCGDGSSNHGLSVFISAIQATSGQDLHDGDVKKGGGLSK